MAAQVLLPQGSRGPGKAQFGFPVPVSVPVGLTRIRVEFDITTFLDPATEFNVVVERSRNGNGGPWELDFAFTRRGGPSFGDGGLPDTVCYLQTDLPEPTNAQRRMRGTVTITGGVFVTSGTVTFS